MLQAEKTLVFSIISIGIFNGFSLFFIPPLMIIQGIIWGIDRVKDDKEEYLKKLQLYEEYINFIEKTKKENPIIISNLHQELQSLHETLERLQKVPQTSNLPKGTPYTSEIEQAYNIILSYHQQITSMQTILDLLYAQNIIHEKYRALIPVSMFCDYFDTGRCDSLTGHEGAYNLYEAELRQDRIIDKLESIEGKLNDIKKNQYYLATSLERGFTRLKESQDASTSQFSSLLSAQTSQYAVLNATATKLLEEGVTLKVE